MDRLVVLTDRWQVKFYTENCKALYFGRDNEKRSFILEGTILNELQEQRDHKMCNYGSLKVVESVEKIV